MQFKSDQDIPSLEGKVILVTSGKINLGKQCVSQLWLVARPFDKAKAAADDKGASF